MQQGGKSAETIPLVSTRPGGEWLSLFSGPVHTQSIQPLNCMHVFYSLLPLLVSGLLLSTHSVCPVLRYCVLFRPHCLWLSYSSLLCSFCLSLPLNLSHTVLPCPTVLSLIYPDQFFLSCRALTLRLPASLVLHVMLCLVSSVIPSLAVLYLTTLPFPIYTTLILPCFHFFVYSHYPISALLLLSCPLNTLCSSLPTLACPVFSLPSRTAAVPLFYPFSRRITNPGVTCSRYTLEPNPLP